MRAIYKFMLLEGHGLWGEETGSRKSMKRIPLQLPQGDEMTTLTVQLWSIASWPHIERATQAIHKFMCFGIPWSLGGGEEGARSTEVGIVTPLPWYRITSLHRYLFPVLPLYRISSFPPYFSSSPPLHFATSLPR